METSRPRNGSGSQLLKDMVGMVLWFLGGMGTMILVSIFSGFVGGYLISLFRVGLHPPWVPIDKNIGLESAVYGIIAGNLLATAGLVWFSRRRRNWMPLWGGVAVFASEFLLILPRRPDYTGPDWGPLILATVLGAFVFGFCIALAFRQFPSSRQTANRG